jgi:toxin YoeB
MIVFENEAWDEYVQWQTEDKKTLKKINLMIKDISRNPFEGIGKPEPLKGDLSGFWSRRINDKDRIIYYIKDHNVYISAIKGHYNDR